MSDIAGIARRAALRAARSVGRQLSEAKHEYRTGKSESRLPRDDAGRAKLVCRRYAEKRAVHLEDGVPECFDAGHPACQGCAEDVQDGSVETW